MSAKTLGLYSAYNPEIELLVLFIIFVGVCIYIFLKLKYV